MLRSCFGIDHCLGCSSQPFLIGAFPARSPPVSMLPLYDTVDDLLPSIKLSIIFVYKRWYFLPFSGKPSTSANVRYVLLIFWRLGNWRRLLKFARAKKFKSTRAPPFTLPQVAFSTTFAMIRQSFLRQHRCLIPHVPSRSISQLHSPFRFRYLDPLPSASAKPLSLRLGRRWASTETDAEAKTNPDPESFSTRGEASSQQTQAEDPLKKELESKNREIIDLKVCHMSIESISQASAPSPPKLLSGYCKTLTDFFLFSRINTSALSPTSATCKSARNETSLLLATLLSSASPPTLSSR
jgi:hypothetical protein